MTNELKTNEYSNQRILTSQQLAAAYGVDVRRISENFNRNKDRYTPGKHYFFLEGEELKTFATDTQIAYQSRTPSLYLWTEKGALQHAKSLNTDRAWQVYEALVDEYFQLAKAEVAQQKPTLQINAPQINGLWWQRLIRFNEKTIIPDGYWCIYGEVAVAFCRLEFQKIYLVDNACPDISIGLHWMKEVRRLDLDESLIRKYPHSYPDQRRMQQANIYPDDWLKIYRAWFQRSYMKGPFNPYLESRLDPVIERI